MQDYFHAMNRCNFTKLLCFHCRYIKTLFLSCSQESDHINETQNQKIIKSCDSYMSDFSRMQFNQNSYFRVPVQKATNVIHVAKGLLNVLDTTAI